MEIISKDLIEMPILDYDTLQDLLNKFYAIMRKYEIKKGTMLSDGSVNYDNFEWTACYALFNSRVQDFFTLRNVFDDVPQDVKYNEV